MQSDTQTAPVSKKMLWAGRILSAIPVLFLVFDGVAKLIKPASVVEATVRLGYPESIIPVLYPRTVYTELNGLICKN
jgi:hypothetical protein